MDGSRIPDSIIYKWSLRKYIYLENKDANGNKIWNTMSKFDK